MEKAAMKFCERDNAQFAPFYAIMPYSIYAGLWASLGMAFRFFYRLLVLHLSRENKTIIQE